MKRIVVCCDGTWNDEDRDCFTNVSRMSRAVLPIAANDTEQIVYYQSGVGTATGWVGRFRGGILGSGLARNVRLAYTFIIDNFCPGDEIFLFGFSRGAYTARSVGGLLNSVGIICKGDLDYFDFIWIGYKSQPAGQGNFSDSEAGKRFTYIDKSPHIRCIGVWDTVGALGIPVSFLTRARPTDKFLNTELGANVGHAFQALALDEQRSSFVPTLWTRQDSAPATQVLEQVWFAGVHSNIGGGYPERGLSDVTLAWMATRVSPLLDLDLAYLVARQDRSADWGMGRLYDSYKRFYHLQGRKRRAPLAVPTAGRNEKIHQSVSSRLAAPNPIPGPYACPALQNVPWRANLAPLTAAEAALGWDDVPPPTSNGLPVAAPPSVPPSPGPPPAPAKGRWTCKIDACRLWNETGVSIIAGETYSFVAAGTWKDCREPCGPAGYQSQNVLHRGLKHCRLAPADPWFALIGAIDRDRATQFLIGTGVVWKATATGLLYCFANDVRFMYFNNFGSIVLLVDWL